MNKIEKLLTIIGNTGACRGCGKRIYWVKTKNMKNMPVEPDGEVHWTNCPKAKEFRKKFKEK